MTQEIKQKINDIRKAHKNKWYFYNCDIDGLNIQLKGFNTWLQIFKINGLDHSNAMEQSVKQFLEHLDTSILYAVNNLKSKTKNDTANMVQDNEDAYFDNFCQNNNI